MSQLTNYDQEAENFAKLPEYSIYCGTDYLAIKDVPDKIKQLKSVTRILDLGCGSGLATRYLKKHFPHALIIGADINKPMLEQAVMADPQGFYLHLQQTDQQIFYPFLANSFDAVICSFVLHENQTRHALEMFLSNIANILRPGGMFLGWDVHENLFQGKWLSIEKVGAMNKVKEGERYTVNILPAQAAVTGTYWSSTTLSPIAASLGLQSSVSYPIVEKHAEIKWLDETRLAPYFLFEATKAITID